MTDSDRNQCNKAVLGTQEVALYQIRPRLVLAAAPQGLIRLWSFTVPSRRGLTRDTKELNLRPSTCPVCGSSPLSAALSIGFTSYPKHVFSEISHTQVSMEVSLPVMTHISQIRLNMIKLTKSVITSSFSSFEWRTSTGVFCLSSFVCFLLHSWNIKDLSHNAIEQTNKITAAQ